METHHKTVVILAGFFLTIAGWWAWNVSLAKIYTPSAGIYAVRNGFTYTFGPDPVWWLTLVIVLAILWLIQMVYKLCKKYLINSNYWPTCIGDKQFEQNGVPVHVEKWQEWEKRNLDTHDST
jgi:phospholipid-translocating ATPase